MASTRLLASQHPSPCWRFGRNDKCYVGHGEWESCLLYFSVLLSGSDHLPALPAEHTQIEQNLTNTASLTLIYDDCDLAGGAGAAPTGAEPPGLGVRDGGVCVPPLDPWLPLEPEPDPMVWLVSIPSLVCTTVLKYRSVNKQSFVL